MMTRRHLLLTVLLALGNLPMLHSQVAFLSSPGRRPDHQLQGLLAKSSTRTLIDLNGEWTYREQGDDIWRTVSVPSSFVGRHHILFHREFTLTSDLLDRSVMQLVALSISYYCEITINGQFIGKHAGNTSFSFKIPPGVLRAGSNTIDIDVHNQLNAYETVPVFEKLWSGCNHGGIVHDIAITANGPVWVQETMARTAWNGEGKPATLEYHAFLNSGAVMKLRNDSLAEPSSTSRMQVQHSFELVETGTGAVVYRSDPATVDIEPDRLVSVVLNAAIPGVRPWSPENPITYTLRQRTQRGSVLLDESTQIIGFKTFQATDKNFLLNGAPYFIKGVTYIEASPTRGRSMSYDEMEQDVLLMKNLGANAIRIISGSVHPYFLELCDRYGLLVFMDLNVLQVPSSILAGQPIQTTVHNSCRELLSRDGSHPCIAAIGLAQGVDMLHDGFQPYFQLIVDLVHATSPYLAYASFATVDGTGAAYSLDFAAVDIAHLDVPRTIRLLNDVKNSGFRVPVLIGSIIYGVEIGNYNGYSDPRSIDAQAQYYLDIIPEVQNRDFSGAFFAPFNDAQLHIPVMTVDRVYQFIATNGIVDIYRQKRLSYDVLKAKFNNEKPPVVVIGNYSPDNPAVFVVIGILLILVFAVSYNLFRRFRENVVRAFLRPFNFFTDVRDQRMLSIFQTSIVGILGSLSAALFYANLTYAWRTNFIVDSFFAQFAPTVWLKQWLNFAAWNPTSNILVVTVLIFCILLLYTLALRAVSFFARKKILLFDAYCVAMWSVLPMALLAIFGMVMYRLMDIALFEFAGAAAFVIFNFWVITRLLKGTAIVLDMRPLWLTITGYVVLTGVVAFWLMSLNSTHGTFANFRYILDLWYYTHSVI